MIIYLYVKQHTITKLKYFGVTRRNDPFKYKGSGVRWNNHINYHGREFVRTLEIYGFDDHTLCTEFALKFSKDNNIVKSDEWANLMAEDGRQWKPASTENKQKNAKKTSERLKGKTYEELYGFEKAKILRENKKIETAGRFLNITYEERYGVEGALEVKEKISENHQSKKEDYNNPFKGKEHTNSTRKLMSDNHWSKKGGIPWNKGTKGKQRCSEKSIEIQRQNGFKKRGTIWINDGIKHKRIKPEDMIYFQGWKRGMIKPSNV